MPLPLWIHEYHRQVGLKLCINYCDRLTVYIIDPSLKSGMGVIVDVREFRSALPFTLYNAGLKVIPVTLQVSYSFIDRYMIYLPYLMHLL